MREIKFRAWDKKEKKMIYEGKIDQWKDDYGDEDYTRVHIHFDGSLSGHISDDGGKNGFWEHDAGLKKDRLILLQFTGLKDKNGREIYEGDLLRFYIQLSSEARPYQKSELIRVSMLYGCWGFEHVFPELCHEDDRAFRPFWKDEDKEMWSQNYFAVIGNIYENPELLGGDGGGLA